MKLKFLLIFLISISFAKIYSQDKTLYFNIHELKKDNMQEDIIDLLINHVKLEKKRHKIGVMVNEKNVVFYSGRSNNYPFKENCHVMLIISRHYNHIKEFRFQNYEQTNNFVSANEFVNYLKKLI